MIGTHMERATERIDLRKGVRRKTAERLVALGAYLPGPDRLLIEAVFGQGRTLPEVAEMLARVGETGAVARQSRRVLNRRLWSLVERMRTEHYRVVVAQMESWSPNQRAVAVACVLHGLSQAEAARRLGLSLHTVRRHHHAVLAFCNNASWKGGRR